MKVAVLSLTRDRLDYTKHCFQTLRVNAGCDYDHYVLDQGSTDGTVEWLLPQVPELYDLSAAGRNLGIARGLNELLDHIDGRGYDVTVNFDNDCELLAPGTLRVVAETAAAHPGFVIGPLVQGLRNPPVLDGTILIDGHRVGVTAQIGGILMPLPAGWRYPVTDHYTYGDTQVCAQARSNGFTVGQLLDYPVNHYETTDGQHERYPWYFERRRGEGIPD